MRIGIYAPFYHPFEGGAERVARRVGQELAKRHEVTVFTLQYDPALPRNDMDGVVRVKRIQFRQRHILGLMYMRPRHLRNVLKEQKLDVLQIHGVTWPNVAANVAILMRLRRVPVVLAPHGIFEAYSGEQKKSPIHALAYLIIVRSLLAVLLWTSSHIALTSPEERRMLKKFKVPQKRATEVYNGFEPPKMETASGERFRAMYKLESAKIVLHVASVKPNKGHAVVVDTLLAVLNTHPNVQYVVVGQYDGMWKDYFAELRATIERENLSDHVTFCGHVTDEVLADCYAAADIVVVPSLAETFPLAVLDAMAWGKPVIASKVGGVAHMITDRSDGLLVPANDRNALANALIRLLSDANFCRTLGQKAATTVRERFGWPQVVARYEQICNALTTSSLNR
jgi:glycosyltransferase involved in cell wall biosynthesis